MSQLLLSRKRWLRGTDDIIGGMTQLLHVIATLAISALSLPDALPAQDAAERLKAANRLEFN
ncbi:MAG TPA: hypothetical protein VK595_09595, partial [Vicinamibacterales bacterium]|nr:hypothetical protein [Vicinamibacterales bacterium]